MKHTSCCVYQKAVHINSERTKEKQKYKPHPCIPEVRDEASCNITSIPFQYAHHNWCTHHKHHEHYEENGSHSTEGKGASRF